jgi:hypothetical protein
MGGPYGEYAAFTYAIPILKRVRGDFHTLAVVYDRAAGVVSWTIDGEEKFAMSNLGFRIGRTHLLLDHGGTEQSFVPSQLNCGMACSVCWTAMARKTNAWFSCPRCQTSTSIRR